MSNSIEEALKGNLIIFGVPPTHPATGYGYIKTEKQINSNEDIPSKVDKFIEKPDEKTAKYFIKDKRVLHDFLDVHI